MNRMTKRELVGWICGLTVVCLLIVMLAHQRLLVVEARLICIYQANSIIAADCQLRGGNVKRASYLLRPAQDISANYLRSRRVLFLEAGDTAKNYCKVHSQEMDIKARKEFDDYIDEVYKKCIMWAYPNYYNVVDQRLLPKLFYIYMPIEPIGCFKKL